MKNIRSVTTAIAILFSALCALALPTSAFKTSSLLSTGHWTEVLTDTTGIFEISYEQLREWGFNDPSKVTVYGYGAINGAEHSFSETFPDDLRQTPSIHTDDGRILFFAEGDVRTSVKATSENPSIRPQLNYIRNHFDFKGHYFLCEHLDAEDAEVYEVDLITPEPRLRWHYCIDLIENEVQNPDRAGALYHDRRTGAGETITMPFYIRDYFIGELNNTDTDPAKVPDGVFYLDLAISANENLRIRANVPDVLSAVSAQQRLVSKNVVPDRIYDIANVYATYKTPADAPLEGTVESVFTLALPATAKIEYAALDKAYTIYPQTIAQGGRPEMIVNFAENPQSHNILISEAKENLEVWNVTDPLSIVRHQTGDYSSYDRSLIFTLDSRLDKKPSRFVIFDPAAQHRRPEYAGHVANQNLHALQTPEMIIVTSAMCQRYAEQLADYHREFQGMDVTVVRHDDIYREFACGSRHPSAIRRFAKMLYDRAPEKFRYLLLYGESSSDNRGIDGDRSDHLVSYQTEELANARNYTTSFASDQYFGMLEDNFDINTIATKATMQLSVGRIPAASPSLAESANRKIYKRLANPMQVRHYLRSLLFSDEGNKNAHYLCSVAADTLIRNCNPAITRTHTDIELLPATSLKSVNTPYYTEIVKSMQNGLGYFTFSGHGNYMSISGYETINQSGASALENSIYPVAMMSTCDVFAFDRVNYGLAERLVLNENGGAIGVIGSCRSVYLEHNRQLNNAVAQQYATASSGTTTGDLLRLARNQLISDMNGALTMNLGVNIMPYNLCGDPAIPIGAPEYAIAIDSSNLTAETANSISGRITDAAGNTVETFSGTAVIDIYDSPVTYTNRIPDESTPAYLRKIQIDDAILATGTAEVVNGRFKGSVALPSPLTPGASHRIVVTATDLSSQAGAAGVMTGIKIAEGSGWTGSAATEGPLIREFYINTPGFMSGNVTGRDITAAGLIEPSASGLKTDAGHNISSATALTLDGDKTLPEATRTMRVNDDGTFGFSFNIHNLTPGRHTLTLKAINNAGLSESATLDFVVADTLEGTLEADVTDPVRDTTVFSFAAAGCEVDEARLVIDDIAGNTVLNKAISGTFEWNVADVADGRYTARVIFRAGTASGCSDAIEIVVLK
ncbi:MAG: hypothetical protein K2J38_02595 [Muribaculaceae bacterium]|nr:hypothetical protein [Muribaculaceae bacterium]